MNADENDKLWKLLGESREADVSPFFARNVLRAVRQEAEARPGVMARVTRAMHRWTWKLAIAGTCAIAAIVTVSPAAFRHHRADDAHTTTSKIAGNPDYEVIKNLDELVADEESSLWLDDSSVH